MCTKFDSSSLSRYLDMDGSPKFKKGHVSQPRPFKDILFSVSWD